MDPLVGAAVAGKVSAMSRRKDKQRRQERRRRMAGDREALYIAKEKGGKKNAAFGGKVNKETPGASAFKFKEKETYNDTPVSAHTLTQRAQTGDGSNMTAAVNFLTRWTESNRTLQKQNESGRPNFGQQAIEQNRMNRADPDPNNMINSMPQYMKDLSTTTFANTFGDPERWKMPKMPIFNTSTIQQNSLKALSKESKKDNDDDD